MMDADGKNIPVQIWITATWPDGSIKWTGHAISGSNAVSDHYKILLGKPKQPDKDVKVNKTGGVLRLIPV